MDFDGDGSIILRSLLNLSTAEAFQARGLCRSVAYLLSDRCHATDFWGLLVSEDRCAAHSASAIWLHALAPLEDVPQYAAQLRSLQMVNEVVFRNLHELHSYTAVVGSSVGRDVVVGTWSFNQHDLCAVLHGSKDRVASNSICCSWKAGASSMLDFTVNLVVEHARNVGCTLAWESSLKGQMLMEGLDYVDLDLSGFASCPGSNTEASFSIGQDRSSSIPESSTLRENLLRSHSLVCILRIVLRSMGEEQQITLADKSMSETRMLPTSRDLMSNDLI
jgi:hypothetical protein